MFVALPSHRFRDGLCCVRASCGAQFWPTRSFVPLVTYVSVGSVFLCGGYAVKPSPIYALMAIVLSAALASSREGHGAKLQHLMRFAKHVCF